VLTLFDYPPAWTERYHEAGYVAIDPTVLHGRRSQTPLVWSDELFASTPQLWAEARSFGVRFGRAQSGLDANGVGGMLTLARSGEAISTKELKANEPRLRWLVNVKAALAHARGDRAQGWLDQVPAWTAEHPKGIMVLARYRFERGDWAAAAAHQARYVEHWPAGEVTLFQRRLLHTYREAIQTERAVAMPRLPHLLSLRF